MRDLNILFMGTPDFAVATLKTLVEHNYNVVGIITAPDRPAGRGRKLKASAVKEYALSQGLTVLQPTNLKNEDFITELRSLNANLNIVVAFRMLPKVVWDMPEYGTFNLHASLLPQYRGAAPINWAIINGEEKTGNTTFFIDEKIDTGHIILQQEIEIDKEENAGELHDKLMIQGSQLVLNTVKEIEKGDVNTIPQPQIEHPKTAYKLNKENTKIDWSQSCDTIFNLVRGLCPYPTAWSYLYNPEEKLTIKVYDVSKEIISHSYSIGKLIVLNNEIKVAVKDGFIILKKIQLPGKRAMEAKALLNGYSFDEKAKLS
ncbi:methionyl-tRNA formyltransferase [Aquimarina rhabdastrellae]